MLKTHIPLDKFIHLDGDTITLDNSGYEKLDCFRRGEYYLVRRKEADVDRAPLVFGAACHEFLKAFYEGKPETTQREAAMGFLAEHPLPPGEWRSPAMLARLISDYNIHRRTTEWDVLEVERGFAVPIGSVTAGGKKFKVVWTGKIDLLVRENTAPHRLLLVDHKTASRMGSTWFNQWDTAGQFKGYLFAYHAMTGVWPAGAVINAIGIYKRPSEGGGFEYHSHYVTHRPDVIQEWRQSVLITVRDFMEQLLHGFTSMRTTQCINKYGQCEYMDVCTAPLSSRESILDSMGYKDVEWNPLD